MAKSCTILLLAALLITSVASRADDHFHTAMVHLFQSQLALANSNSASAQYFVGEMYENGFGIQKNLDKAFTWYARAAQNGDAEAAKKIRQQQAIRRRLEAHKKLAVRHPNHTAATQTFNPWEQLASAETATQSR